MMRLATGHRPPTSSNNGVTRAGFTLVELIVVMTILVVTVAVLAPSFKGFLRGRNLNNEARRFLSITHYGSQRAISESVPVDLWIDVKTGRYGLAASGGYTETKTNAVEYTMDKDLKMMASQPTGTLTMSNWWTPQATRSRGRLPIIRFQPDGFISETSPQNVVFADSAGGNNKTLGTQIWVVENPNHTRYELDLNHRAVSRF
jgi:prepilin-type N-terminal cleavage/methylation domain-containing protein